MSTTTDSDPFASVEFPWDVPDPLPLVTHPDPPDEGPAAALNVFYALVRDSREVCSHCFARIRAVSTYSEEAKSHWRRSKRIALKRREDSIAIDDGGIGYDGYRTQQLSWDARSGEYRVSDGTIEPRVSCERCGWLGTRTQNRRLSYAELKARVPRLVTRLVWQAARYRCPEARHGYEVIVDLDALYDAISDLDGGHEYDGRDSQLFAEAVRRSVSLSPRADPDPDRDADLVRDPDRD